MEKMYVIKDLRDGTYYFNITKVLWSDDIWDAELFDTKEEAKRVLDSFDRGFYEVVKIYKIED